MSFKPLYFAECWYWFVLAAVACYFIGCFNFAVLISHIKKKDIRTQGSGNPGTMNMTRTFGLKIGVINFICDAAKGGVPAVIGWAICKDYVFAGTAICNAEGVIVGGAEASDFIRYLLGTCVIIGHIFPITMKFKGGKGIASTMGLFTFSLPCEKWWYIFICLAFLALIFIYIAFTEWGSMGSLAGVAGFTIWQAGIFVLKYGDKIFNRWMVLLLMMLLTINLLTWLRHSSNIIRLLAGEEHHTSVKKHKKKL